MRSLLGIISKLKISFARVFERETWEITWAFAVKHKGTLIFYTSSTFVVLIYGQNCTSSYNVNGTVSNLSQKAYSEEDEIWSRIRNAEGRIVQLRAIDFSESEKNPNRKIVGKSPGQLADELQAVVDNLNNMLLVRLLPSNSDDVTKKYTSLVDLLSESRDILIMYYSDLEMKEFTERMDSFQYSFEDLSATVASQGEIFKAYQQKNDKNMKSVVAALGGQMAAADGVAHSLMNIIDANKATYAAVQADLITPLKQSLEGTQDKFEGFKTSIIASRSAGSVELATALKNMDCNDTIDTILSYGGEKFQLTGNIKDTCLVNRQQVLYDICRNAYDAFCGSCKGDQYADYRSCPAWSGNDLNEGGDINPNYLTPKEKLGILVDIEQWVSIQKLKQQVANHQRELVGTHSCKDGSLDASTGRGKPNCIPEPFTTNLPSVCFSEASTWDDCGIRGKLYKLKLQDENLASNLASLEKNMSASIQRVNTEFEREKEFTNIRFAQLSTQVKQRLELVEQTMDQKIKAITDAMSNVPVPLEGSAFATQLQEAMVQYTSQLKTHSALSEALFNLRHLPGWEIPQVQVNELLGEYREAVVQSLVEGMIDLGVSQEGSIYSTGFNGASGSLYDISNKLMMDVLFAKFDRDIYNESDLPAYEITFRSMVGDKVTSGGNGHCSLSTTEMPDTFGDFKTLNGRDARQILIIGLMRMLLRGDGPVATKDGAKLVFADHQIPIVNSSILQKAFIADAFDYRSADFLREYPAGCLEDIERWVRYSFENNLRWNDQMIESGKVTQRSMVGILNEEVVHNIILNFVQRSKVAMDTLFKLESRIAIRSPPPPESDVKASLAYKNTLEDLAIKIRELAVNKAYLNIAKQAYEKYSVLVARDDSSESKAFRSALRSFVQKQQEMVASIGTLQAVDGQLAVAMGNMSARFIAVEKNYNSQISALNLTVSKLEKQVSSQAVSFIPRIESDGGISHLVDNNYNATCRASSLASLPKFQGFINPRTWCGVYYDASTIASNVNKVHFKVFGALKYLTVTYSGDSTVGNYSSPTWAKADYSNIGSTITAIPGSAANGGRAMNISVVSGDMANGSFSINVPGLINKFGYYGIGYFDFIAATDQYAAPKVRYSLDFQSPLVLTFKQKGILRTMSINEGVEFDIYGDGKRHGTGWVAPEEGGFLALDLNGNARIDSNKELFGDVTEIKATGISARNGFEALSQYDTNGDSYIDSRDSIYSRLQVWFDLNRDGKSSSREVVPLASLGVTKIELKYNEVAKNLQMENMNRVLYQAKFYGPKQCGELGCLVYDVFFMTGRMHKLVQLPLEAIIQKK